MDATLVRHHGLSPNPRSDVRNYRVHEVTSPPIALQPVATGNDGVITSGTDALSFHGAEAEVREVAGRRLTLLERGGRARRDADLRQRARGLRGRRRRTRMWALSVDAPPRLFRREEFDDETGAVTVLGNLVDAHEGKAVPAQVVGNGGARASFQTFRLPKPLTYHLAPGATPPHAPELTVTVGNRGLDARHEPVRPAARRAGLHRARGRRGD